MASSTTLAVTSEQSYLRYTFIWTRVCLVSGTPTVFRYWRPAWLKDYVTMEGIKCACVCVCVCWLTQLCPAPVALSVNMCCWAISLWDTLPLTGVSVWSRWVGVWVVWTGLRAGIGDNCRPTHTVLQFPLTKKPHLTSSISVHGTNFYSSSQQACCQHAGCDNGLALLLFQAASLESWKCWMIVAEQSTAVGKNCYCSSDSKVCDE